MSVNDFTVPYVHSITEENVERGDVTQFYCPLIEANSMLIVKVHASKVGKGVSIDTKAKTLSFAQVLLTQTRPIKTAPFKAGESAGTFKNVQTLNFMPPYVQKVS